MSNKEGSGFGGFKPAGAAGAARDQGNATKASENLDATRIIGESEESADAPATLDVGNQRGQVVANQQAGDYVTMFQRADEDDDEAKKLNHHYSSRPISRYVLGRFEFMNGYLSLNNADAKEFEDILSQQPVSEMVKVAKLSRSPEPIQEQRMFTGIDNSANAPAAPVADRP